MKDNLQLIHQNKRENHNQVGLSIHVIDFGESLWTFNM